MSGQTPHLKEVGSTASESNPKEPPKLEDQAAEAGAYLSSYLSAQGDRLKLGVRNTLFGLGLYPLVLFLLGGSLLLCLAFCLYGVALGLSEVFAGKLWLSYLVTGTGFLIALLSLFWFLLARLKNRGLKQQLTDYETELENQRRQFSHDAESRAQNP